MSKVATYLQDHLVGEVSTTPAARQYFALDASTLRQVPQIVVAPKNEQDVRKVTRFAWQLAERGKVLPIVARGAGTDLTGASIGQTITMTFTPHMNKVLEFDDRKGTVVTEPGANFGRLQHMLSFSHGRYVPAFPASYEYSTIGGAIINNAAGERSMRFGPMANFVDSLRIVLANGEVLETGRISKRDVNKKMGMATFEGEIYRAVDALLNEHQEALKEYSPHTLSNAGYNIKAVREKDGSVDLTPLFLGSKGTLGFVTQATLTTSPYRNEATVVCLLIANRVNLHQIAKVIDEEGALACEYYDQTALIEGKKVLPNLLAQELGDTVPAGIIVAEFPKENDRGEQKLVKKLAKKLKDAEAVPSVVPEERQEEVFRLKRLVPVLLSRKFGSSQFVPGIEEVVVPLEAMGDFLTQAEELFAKHAVTVFITARAGSGVVSAYPLFDLGQLGDRQRLMRLTEEYCKLVLSTGGSVAGPHGDGRTRGGFIKAELGDVLYDIMQKVKQIFDPYGILNPGVKVEADHKAVLALLRQEYELPQLYTH